MARPPRVRQSVDGPTRRPRPRSPRPTRARGARLGRVGWARTRHLPRARTVAGVSRRARACRAARARWRAARRDPARAARVRCAPPHRLGVRAAQRSRHRPSRVRMASARQAARARAPAGPKPQSPARPAPTETDGSNWASACLEDGTRQRVRATATVGSGAAPRAQDRPRHPASGATWRVGPASSRSAWSTRLARKSTHGARRAAPCTSDRA